jgi:diguanylate cyclase (GGDEF)-like protein
MNQQTHQQLNQLNPPSDYYALGQQPLQQPKPPVHRCQRSLPLQLVLVVPFVVQVCIAVGLTGWFSFRSGQQAVQDLATQLQREVSDRIMNHTQRYLTTPVLINQLNASEITTQQLDPANTDRVIRHFVALHHVFRSGINHISLGNQDGTYVAVRRSYGKDPFEILLVPSDALGRLHTYRASTQGDRISLRKISMDYDPRQRPWYQKATRAGKPGWSDVYNYFDVTTLGISHIHPIYANGALQGVLATDFDLGDISQFLQGLTIGKTGQAFIIERSGHLVASSHPENLFVILPTGTQRITASQSQSKLIQQSARYLQSQFPDLSRIDRAHQRMINTPDGIQFLQVMPLVQEEGIQWLLVVVIPRSDFMDEMYRNAWLTVMFCGLTLVVSGWVGFLICSHVSKGILRFSRAAQGIAKGELVSPSTGYAVPPITELVTLAGTFEQMHYQLQESFTALEQTNRSLENRVAQRTLELQQANQALYRLAIIDELTQIANRRRFDEYLAEEWQRAMRENHPLALILCDVDCFKAYNDTYGHRAGDVCLQQVAWAITQVVHRPADLIARYGGEEFAIILPDTDLSGASHVAEQLRQSVYWLRLPHERSSASEYVTVSLGVCSVVPDFTLSSHSLIDTADKALYEAKASGRNTYRVKTL